MLNVLYNDLPADVLDFELACESAELRADRAVATYRAICEKAELDLREAELLCIQESGDMDSLEDLYMEAEEKTDDKKQGVLASVWAAIKNFFERIKNFFTGKKKEIDPKSKGQINQGTDSFFKTGIAKIRQFLSKVKTLIGEHKAASIAIAAATTLGGVVAVKAILSKNKDTENEANKAKDPKETTAVVTISGETALRYIEAGNSLCEEGEKVADDVAEMKIDDPSILDLVKAIIHKICETIKAQMGKITAVFTNLKNKGKKGGDSSDDNSGQTPDTKDSGNKIEQKKSADSGNKIEQKKSAGALPDKVREAGVKGGKEAGAEWAAAGGTESAFESVDEYDDDDIMIESSADYEDYDDDDNSYLESADEELDHLLGDLL